MRRTAGRGSFGYDRERARRVFLAALGLVFVAAFGSLLVQIEGLIGSRGLLPVADVVERGAGRLDVVGVPDVWSFPTLCLLDASDGFLVAQCVAGIVLGGMLFVGVAPMVALIGLWTLYLSLMVAGQEFLSFQWESLLLDTGFFAFFVAPFGLLPWGPPRWLLFTGRRPDDPMPPPPTAAGVWAIRLLLFRFMFETGYVKLSFDDPAWRDLTALTWHYWTQPIPTPFAWFAAGMSTGFHELSCGAMFVVELALPWLVFAGWLGRRLFAAATMMLMTVLAATGNYGFFEPLTLVLCLAIAEQPGARPRPPIGVVRCAGRLVMATAAAGFALLALIPFGFDLVKRRLRLRDHPRTDAVVQNALDGVEWLCTTEDEETGTRRVRAAGLLAALAPFRTLNTYGLFRVMTKERHEIVLEGSDDLVTWKAYEFRFKPGDPARPPPWCMPHMPRLDWQMWFAALRPSPPLLDWERWFAAPPAAAWPRPWFRNLLRRLLEGEPEVLALFEPNPFPGAPPKHVRSVLYDYRFTTAAERAKSGDWWVRTELGLYSPPVSLR